MTFFFLREDGFANYGKVGLMEGRRISRRGFVLLF